MLRRASFVAFLMCFIASLFCVLQFLLQGSPSLMVNALMDEFDMCSKDIGFLSSAFFYPYIILQVPSGLIVDKYGPRKVLLLSSLLLTLATLFFSLSHSLYSADLARFFMGVASAPGVIACLGLAAIYFPSRFAIMAGFVEMMGLLGGALGDIILEYFVIHYDWRGAMLVCAIFGLLVFILIAMFVKLPRNNKSAVNKQSEVVSHYSLFDNLKDLKLLVTDWMIWRSCLYGAFLFSLISAFAALWSIQFLKIYYPNHSHLAASATSFVFIGAAVGAIVSGYLSKEKGMIFVMRLFSLMVFILFLTLLIFSFSFGFINILLFFIGFFAGAYILPFEDVKKQVSKNIESTAMGFTNMLMLLIGGPVLQPLIGAILDKLSPEMASDITVTHFQLALIPIAVGLLIACLLSFLPKHQSVAVSAV